ncbi:hypothetical protein BN946_scf184791.g23 [Trametes cinnabarina]|uniref:Uncharacterized protein n=1 Tax=Pycnoporus cinnabarinus TaxID=5643 RepID=A0A060SAL1_PYCCI|nr:hypothetical protein BN946_scf184791.g23 [Trametes cinnabarina]
MSERGLNIWGVIGSVLGLILAIIPAALWIVQRQMPSKNLHALDALLQETEQLLSSAVDDGLIAHEEFRPVMWTACLGRTKYRIDKLRAQGYAINSWKDEYHNWKNGLTKRAIVLCHELNKIRATIAQSSSERRAKLGKAGKVTEFGLSSPQRATQETAIIPSVEQALAQPPSSALSSDPAAMQCASDPTSQSGNIANIVCQSAEPSKTRAYTRPSPKVNCSVADTDRVCERIDLAHDARKKRRLSQRALLMRWGKTFSTPHASHLPHNPSLSSKHTPAKPSRLKAFSRLLSRADTSTLPYTSGDAKDRPHTVAMILAGELWEDYDGDDESD